MSDDQQPIVAVSSDTAQRAILDLVKLSTAEHSDHVETIDNLLRALKSYFDLPLGIVSRIDGDQYEVEYVSDQSGEIQPGLVFSLPETYCERVISLARPLYVPEAVKSLFSGHPCYEQMGLETYVGARIFVAGRVYGTVNLTAPHVRPRPFSADDMLVFETGAALVGHHVSLHHAEERYRLVVEGANAGVWDWDVVTNTHFWSSRYREMLGITDPAFVASRQAFLDRIHPEDIEKIRELVTAEPQAHKPLELEYRARHEDGHWVHVLARGQAIWNAAGKLVRMAGSVEDVSARVAAEEKVRESTHLRRMAGKVAQLGYWHYPFPDGPPIWSEELYELHGVTRESFDPASDDPMQFVHPDDRSALADLDRRTLEADTPQELEYRVVRKDGEIRNFLARSQCQCDETGTPLSLFGVYQDITEVKRAEKHQRDRARMLDLAGKAAKVGYFEIDLASKSVELSDELIPMFGFDPGQESFNLDDLVGVTHPDDRDRVGEAIEAAVGAGEPQMLSKRIRRADDGEERLVHTWLERFVDIHGHPDRLFGVTQDVTEQREVEMRLLEQAAELQRTNEELGRFAVVASHDLQEPLRKVSSFGGMLAKRYADALDDDGRRIVDIMVDGTTRMQLLIDDLLRYSKSSNAEMDLVDIDLNALFAALREDLSVAIDETGARMTVGDLPVIRGDAALVRLLFQNLVSNSIKYRGDTTLEIEISAIPDETHFRIQVRDNGIGFDNAHADRIFEMFKRLHSRADYPGTGIGLALCHRIAQRHGGKIEAEGREGEGARFCVSFPLEGSPLHSRVAIQQKSPT